MIPVSSEQAISLFITSYTTSRNKKLPPFGNQMYLRLFVFLDICSPHKDDS
jgi:hypothetical protein